MEQIQRRFYRSNLHTIVWDADNDRALADFGKGHFTTSDPKIADKLLSLGYPEIEVDAQQPPDVLIQKPSRKLKGDVPLMGKHQASIVVEKNLENATTTEEIVPRKPLVKETLTSDGQEKKTKPGKTRNKAPKAPKPKRSRA